VAGRYIAHLCLPLQTTASYTRVLPRPLAADGPARSVGAPIYSLARKRLGLQAQHGSAKWQCFNYKSHRLVNFGESKGNYNLDCKIAQKKTKFAQ
jgi:hypothetical protein